MKGTVDSGEIVGKVRLDAAGRGRGHARELIRGGHGRLALLVRGLI